VRASPSVLSSVASVVAYRLRMLSLMIVSPTPARRREAVRMATEKLQAAGEGALAMQVELLRQARSLWTGGVTGRRLSRAGRRILDAGAAPARRRVLANGLRLGRRSAP
jgi:hypothetical protein